MKKPFFLLSLILGIGAFTFFHEEPAYAASSKNDARARDTVRATVADAEAIFGADCLGKTAISLAFGEKYADTMHIPNPPYTIGELKMFKREGFILAFQVSSLGGKPATIERIRELFRAHSKENPILELFKEAEKEDFFCKETPDAGWVLVTDNVIEESVNQNYLGQTSILNNYSRYYDTVIKNLETGDQLSSSLKKVDSLMNGSKHKTLTASDSMTLKKASQMLTGLKTNASCRESAVSVFYRMILYYGKNHDPEDAMSGRLFSRNYVWTKSLSKDGTLIGIGFFLDHGMAFDRQFAYTKGNYRGTTFSYRK